MSQDNDHQREFIGKCAFILMLGGALVPLAVAALVLLMPGLNLSSDKSEMILLLVGAFSVLSEVLALVLGIVCRRLLLGKVAICGSGTLLVLAMLSVGFFTTGSIRTSDVKSSNVNPRTISISTDDPARLDEVRHDGHVSRHPAVSTSTDAPAVRK